MTSRLYKNHRCTVGIHVGCITAMHYFREANHSEVLCIPYIFIFIKVDTYLKLGNSMVIQVSAWTKFDPPNSVVYTAVYTNPFSHRHVSVENELKKANLEDILVAKIVKGRWSSFLGSSSILPFSHSWVIYYGVTCVVTYGVICGNFWSPFAVFLCCHVLRDLCDVSWATKNKNSKNSFHWILFG